jgi:hypothetical protein
MDRITRAVVRLWGFVGKDGQLHGSPRFADDLSAQCGGKLVLRAPIVSKWSFGQQLEHLYRSSHYVLDRLEESMTGENASERMGFWGRGLMVGGFIPRGAFPTIPPLEPASGTMADIRPLRESLIKRLSQIDWNLVQIKASPGKSRHPRMKWLSSSQWLFFADIHHRHHLAIMRDIVKSAG